MTPLPRPNRTTGGVAALLMLVLAAAGCSSDGSQAASTPSPSAPAPTASSSAAGTADTRYPLYVALGDSYTAAPLVPDTNVSNGCLRVRNEQMRRLLRSVPAGTPVEIVN